MKKELRKQVWDKYAGHCAYCGKAIKFKDMQVDHKVPLYRYETGQYYIGKDPDEFSNLMPSCRRCNHYKRAHDLETFRHYIETIPSKLYNNQYIFKVGVDYKFFKPEDRKVEFFFERYNREMQEYIDKVDKKYENIQ